MKTIMKKLLFFAAFAVFGLTMDAQEKTTKDDVNKATDAVAKEATKLYNQAKTGGFKVGANIGFPLQDPGNLASFNMGLDIAWLFEVANNVEVGVLTGYTHIFGDDEYNYYPPDYSYKSSSKSGIVTNYKDTDFIPIAATGRWYFSNRKMYAGLDLGYAISLTDGADGGIFFRPKFGYNLGKVNLVGSFQKIGGGVEYYDNADIVKVSGFNSMNFGVEFAF